MHLGILDGFKYDIVYRKLTDDGFNYLIDIRYDFIPYFHRVGPIPLPLVEDTLNSLIDMHHEAMRIATKLFDKDETL